MENLLHEMGKVKARGESMEEKFNYAFLELDGETVNHLLEELPEAMGELEELYQMINKLSWKASL